jgi:lysophospholipase L1-like esterase
MLRCWASALLAAAVLAGCGGETRDPEAPTADPLRYGVIGDSYSNGEGLGPEQAWPVELAERLGAELVVNPAVSGYTADDAIAAELAAFEQADPEVATLMIGANDAFGGRPLASFRRSFRALLGAMTRIVGDARRIVVVTIPDYTRKPLGEVDDPSVIRRFNALITAEARRAGAPVADVYATSREEHAPSPDGLHPSAGELQAWTDAIEPVARRAWRGLP